MAQALVTLNAARARTLLARVCNPVDAKRVVDLAHAAKIAAIRQGARDAAAECHEIEVEALAVMGAMLKVGPKNNGRPGPGRGRKGEKASTKKEQAFPPPPTQEQLFGKGGRKVAAQAQAIAEVKEQEPQLFEDVKAGRKTVGQAVEAIRREKKKAEGEGDPPIVSMTLGSKLWAVNRADCLKWFAEQPADSINLVFGSPPYEQARLYLENGENHGIARNTEEWVAWMVEVYKAALHCCKGLVAFVVAGQTKKYRWSAGPALLMADLHRAGIHLRNPPLYRRIGIPGSGGPDWLRNDYEFIVCAARGGQLPWSDNTACGHPPKYEPGGEPSYRQQDGRRVNHVFTSTDATQEERNNVGPHRARRKARREAGKGYTPPEKANPGNVIDCGAVGGGNMGDPLCHENEAPFPESLPEFFVRSFCPRGGIVCDPFCGSATTGKMAVRHGRRFLGCDIRESQVKLARRRLAEVQQLLPLED
jgi:DNA methylase